MANSEIIYFDNAATTRVDDAVAEAMVEVMTGTFGNPSSLHRLGIAASQRLDGARRAVAGALGAAASEIYFTSGGTEANTMGILGAAAKARGRHIIISALEHSSVSEAAHHLAETGYEVEEAASTPDGVVTADALAAKVQPDTALIALMLVSNELGTIQPVWEAARRAKAISPRAHFHVDAVQAFGKLPIDLAAADASGVDSLAVSAHKIHGPKGAGALWLRRGVRIVPRTWGGGQEQGVRPGTPGVPGAVGLGKAAELAASARPEAMARLTLLRSELIAGLRAFFPALRVHGEGAPSAPHILSLGFPGVPAEPLLHLLEAGGVFVSAGSACSSHERKPSHTLQAIGVPADVGTLRFSFSRCTSAAEIQGALAVLREALGQLGGMRPRGRRKD